MSRDGKVTEKEDAIKLSKVDGERRRFVLQDNMWYVLWCICFPLVLYQSLGRVFKFLDIMMAAHIGSEAVSAVAYLSQLSNVLAAIGNGLAVGGSISIANNYGAGNYTLVKKQVSTLMTMAIGLGTLLLIIMIPFAEEILVLANTPADLIDIGKPYFVIEVLSIVVVFINNVYIAIERARGNTKRILVLNLVVFSIKFILTAFFVYVLNSEVIMVAVASLISHVVITVVGLYYLCGSKSVFGIGIRYIKFDRQTSTPMIRLSIPVIAEKCAFSMGKVIINSMSAIYGSLVVGALGVSNNIGGFLTSVCDGVQQGGASIISQNLGNNNFERAIDAYKKILIINFGLSLFGYTITNAFMIPLVNLFAEGDEVFGNYISDIYRYESIGLIILSVNASVMALLYGFGYTRLSLVINFCRLFVFRIPVLYILQEFTNLREQSVGVTMMISNSAVSIFAWIIACIVIRKERIVRR